jgi:pyridoxal 5'-phosphate synthase pdxT subunit
MATVGILALQGDYEAHARAIERAGGRPAEVRTAAELGRVSALVIPGGESTTMLKLIGYYGLMEPLREFGAARPVFGTCAGAILIASEVLHPAQQSLGLVDMAIERNAYGRQLDSRVARIAGHGLGGEPELEVVLIRAPAIRRVGEGGEVLARYQGQPVLVDFGRHLAATFHPELTADVRIHRRFLDKVKSCGG